MTNRSNSVLLGLVMIGLLASGAAFAKKNKPNQKPKHHTRSVFYEDWRTQVPSGISQEHKCADLTPPSGLVEVVSTEFQKAETLGIRQHATEEFPVTYTVTTMDFSIVGLNENVNATEPKPPSLVDSVDVLVEPDQTSSERFWVYGKQMKPVKLHIQRHPDPPEHGGRTYDPWYMDVNIWEVEDIVDYGNIGDKSNVCYDPVNSPDLNMTPPDLRTTCGTKPDLVATDGTTRLLVRVRSNMPGQACIKPVGDDDTPDNPEGTTDPEDSSIISFSSDLADPYWTFGTYVAPDEYGPPIARSSPITATNPATRKIELEVAFNPTTAGGALVDSNTLWIRKEIELARPPALFIHGVWSNPSGLKSNIGNYGTYIEKMDWSANNADGMDEVYPEVGKWVKKTLTKARKNYKNKKLAVTKVDVAAHSMGGLLTRYWIKDNGNKRAENFFSGDIHRLAQIATPNNGSQIANMFITAKDNIGGTPEMNIAERRMKFAGMKINRGAVCDLAENSDALGFPAQDVQARSFLANAGPVGDFHWLLSNLFLTAFTSVQKEIHIDPYTFHYADGIHLLTDEINDAIVLLTSQQAATNGVGEVYNNTHSPLPFNGISKNVDVVADVHKFFDGVLTGVDLQQIVSKGDGKIYRGINNDVLNVVGRGVLDGEAYNVQCAPNGPMRQ